MIALLKRHFRPEQLRELSLVLLIVLIFLFFSTQIEGYFSPRIFNRVTSDVAILAVVAIGETLCLLTKNYDLSVGSVVGMTAFFTGKLLSFYPETTLPIFALVFAVGLGAACGLINGTLVAYGRVPSLIVTFGTMAIYRSILVGFPAGTKNVVTHELPEWILNLGRTNLLSIGEFEIKPLVAGGLVLIVYFNLRSLPAIRTSLRSRVEPGSGGRQRPASPTDCAVGIPDEWSNCRTGRLCIWSVR
jgi:rhamnose transport system permease protein